MKKIFYLMSICALAFVSCQKEELAGNEAADGKYTYTFTVDHTAEAKASVGDKNGTQWPVLWEKGDKIGVYDVVNGTFIGTADLKDESAGKNSGTFVLTTGAVLTDGKDLYFSYPYVESATIKAGSIAAKQSLASASSAGIGANALAYAKAKYAKAGTKLTLTHANAYLKFNVSSTEFNGYSLEGVTLWADGSELSGAATIADDGKLTVTGAEDYVKATLKESVTVGSTAKQVWLTALPADLSGKTVYAIVHMTKGIQTVTLPVKLKGAKSLLAGAVTEITLPALTKSLAPSWYEPVETRYIADHGNGWCYGTENTIVFTQSGQTQTIDLKARGNFMKVKRPAYVQMCYQSNLSDRKTTQGIVKIDNQESCTGTAQSEFEVGDDVAIDLWLNKTESNPRGHMAAMYIKDADKNVIWGLNFWLVLAPFTTVQYDKGAILDRNLGASTSIVTDKTWASNGCHFQWGRPWAFPNSTSRGTASPINAYNAKVTLEISAANPYAPLYYPDKTLYDWYYGDGTNDKSNDLNDLWGHESQWAHPSTQGKKSIYDPCPQGYRVCDPLILKEVEDGINATISEGKVVSTGETVVNTSSTNLYYLEYKGAYWGFGGAFWATGSWAQKNNKVSFAEYWANNAGNQASYARTLYIQVGKTDGSALNTSISRSLTRSKAEGALVRCMVDTENR